MMWRSLLDSVRDVNWYHATAEEVAKLSKLVAILPDDLPVGMLPSSLYAVVQGFSVTPTSDFIPTLDVEGGRKFALTQRNEPPWKGQFMVPGGKIKPLEHPEVACRRHANRELGFMPSEVRFAGYLPVLNPENQQGGRPWFSLWHFFEVPVGAETQFSLNRENSKLTWFDEVSPDFIEPVKQALSLIGFKSKAIAA